jgi:drug/metabolite transporter (DMT)-like permease
VKRDEEILVPAASSTGFLFVTMAAAVWGTDALFRRGLALELPAAAVVLWEHAILVVLTVPLLKRALSSSSSLRGSDLVALLVVGAGASAAATVLFTAAFTYGDPTTPLLLQKLQPLIAVGGAHVLLRERITTRYPVYFVLALLGAYLVTFSDPLHMSLVALTPAVLAIAAATLWGLGTVLGRRLTAKIPFAELTALRFAIGLPAAALILFFQDGSEGFSAATLSDAPALILLALIPGLFALMLYYRGLRQTPAAAATLGELAFPLSALVVNYLAFGVTLEATQLIGLVLLSATISAMGIAGRHGSEAMGIRLQPSPALQR